MSRFFSVLCLLVLCGTAAFAQKRCVKGIPCGNTCIAANKTCHVGQGTATSVRAPERPAERAAERDTTVASRDSTLKWIAHRTGGLYFQNNRKCRTDLSIFRREDIVFFKSEEDAKKFGLQKAEKSGC